MMALIFTLGTGLLWIEALVLLISENEEKRLPRFLDLSDIKVLLVLGFFWIEFAAVDSRWAKSVGVVFGISKVLEKKAPCVK